jgi:hypothetical protein
VTVVASNTALYTLPPLIEHEQYTVRELTLSWEKVALLWEMISKFRTLFSDLTRGDINNFLRFIMDTDSVWLEIYNAGNLNGIVCLTNLQKVIDTDAHVIFFDREVANKVDICKAIVRWAFDTLPLQRMSVDVPVIYHRTIRLVRNIGFKHEGERRQAVLIGGHWLNVLQFGILRREVYQ